MFQKNSLVSGLLFGLLLPILGFGVLYGIFSLLESAGFLSDVGFRPYFRERMISIVAIALNGMALNYYNKRRFYRDHAGYCTGDFCHDCHLGDSFQRCTFRS